MKKVILFLLAVVCLPALATPQQTVMGADELKSHECPMRSDEKLVCAIVMCDFGLIMGEWSSECTQYKIDFARYLATLGFWDKPPKCFMRDENCGKAGKAQKASADVNLCDNQACLKGSQINNASCDELEGAVQKACYKELAKQTGDCDQLTGNDKYECMGITASEPIDPHCVNVVGLQAKSQCNDYYKNLNSSSSSSSSSSAEAQ